PYTTDDDPRAGLRLGFKGAQITISAIRGEIQSFANPISITSSPTEALNQDKVSMGTISARKLRDQIDLLYLQLGVHLLAVCQAIDLIGAEQFSPFTQRVHAEVRRLSAFVQDDRALDKESAAVSNWLLRTELFA
ncbi:MAG: aromatic amino acid ammonia-lyase, partial [Treponemataceae bacterium]|nr:aromatic amino acid ammonia-lyase [Treponemataceae bacterium]